MLSIIAAAALVLIPGMQTDRRARRASWVTARLEEKQAGENGAAGREATRA
jgi:hypothetical protein